MAKLSDALSMPVAYVADDLRAMFNVVHPWPMLDHIGSGAMFGKSSPRIEVRVHAEAWTDHRRFCRLFSVWLDGSPVAVGRHSGRDGDDSVKRLIVDRQRYIDLVEVLRKLTPIVSDIDMLMYDPDVGDLTEWHGHRIEPGKAPWRMEL